MRIVITGNANSGKSTLFNGLTNSNLRVGNWHGVTVTIAKATFMTGKEKHTLYDIPGINGFDTFTLEQKVSVDFLKQRNYDLIINVIEASRLNASINLIKDLMTLHKPIICIVNMTADLIKRGGNIDFDLLNSLYLKFIPLELNVKRDIKKLKYNVLQQRIPTIQSFDLSIILKSFTPPAATFTRADKLLTNKCFCLALFSIIIVVSFYLSFGAYGPGKIISNTIIGVLELLIEKVRVLLCKFNASLFISGLICDGILTAISSLFAFLPSILILNFVLLYLEQSGIIARISFAFDDVLSKIGLNGRAVFAILMGFGCTTVSVLMTNGLENKALKKRVILGLPFISCSAKLPVYLYICSRLFEKHTTIILSLIYIIGIMFCTIICKFDKSINRDRDICLLMELPTIRLKCVKNMVKPLINSIKQFIIKISTVLVVVSVAVFLLSSLSPSLHYLSPNNISESLLAAAGKAVTIIFYPIGIYDYKISCAVLSGLFAKEAVISTLSQLSSDFAFSPLSGIALVSFIAFYPPCLSTLLTIKKECGFKGVIKIFVVQTLFALLLSYFIYFIVKRPIITINFLAIVLISFLIFRVCKKNENLLRRQK